MKNPSITISFNIVDEDDATETPDFEAPLVWRNLSPEAVFMIEEEFLAFLQRLVVRGREYRGGASE